LKDDDMGIIKKFKLENCSIAIMTPVCQQKYKHGIEKEKNLYPRENKNMERISLTFRNFISAEI
jgi:flagellar biosynthesis protein FliP